MISAILLAAGESKRMKDENKLIKEINGLPLIKHAVKNILGSSIKERSDRKKTSTKRNTYKPKSNYRSNNRSNYKSRSSGFKSSGSKNISRSPKRK